MSVASNILGSCNLVALAHTFLGGSDDEVVAIVALLLFDSSDSRHGLLGLVDEDIVGTTLVM